MITKQQLLLLSSLLLSHMTFQDSTLKTTQICGRYKISDHFHTQDGGLEPDVRPLCAHVKGWAGRLGEGGGQKKDQGSKRSVEGELWSGGA